MLASCVSSMIVRHAQRRDWELGDVRVEVSYATDTTPREVQIAVHLPSGLTEDQVTRLRRVADICPVRRALESGFHFSEEIVSDLPAVATAR